MSWEYKHVKEYLILVKRVKKAFDDGYEVKLTWHEDAVDVISWRKEFVKALDARIKLKGNISLSGKKFESMYQTGLVRDKRRLEDIRNGVRVYQFESGIVKKRFGNLLATYE